MSEYLLPNGEITNAMGVKKVYPNVSINFSNLGDLATFVFPTPKPECGELQRVVRDGVTTDSKGNTVQSWKVVDMFTQDITLEDGTIKTIAEQEAEYLTTKEANELKQKIETATRLVDEVIKAEIDNYNEANGVKMAGVDALAKYALVPTSAHYDFAISMVAWVDNVWTSARTSTATTEETFLAGLPTRT